MKKVSKIFLICFGFLLVSFFGVIVYFYASTASIKLDHSRLIDLQRTVTYYDKYGKEFAHEANGTNICEFSKIPTHTKNAFISIEDKRFYSHNGVDFRGLFRALLSNIKSGSFKEGASTISQQLIKNTHLSSNKTLNRKLAEVKLALELEKYYTKDEILEKYLNTIYFGDNCYGITNASKHYFNKSPESLSINESAVLAGLIKAPSNYSPFVNYDKCVKRKNVVLEQMKNQDFISSEEYERLVNEKIKLNYDDSACGYDYLHVARKEFYKILNLPYLIDGNIKIYTSLDPIKQEILLKNLYGNDNLNVDKSGVIIDKSGKIEAYYCNKPYAVRQMGSVAKPIMVYAPAIENNIVYSATLLNDEKTDFGGYQPKNFNDKYYGHVSVKDSLAKSLNVCAVKLLHYTGIEKSIEYVQKTDIPLTKEDNSLCLALGATQSGATLTQITSAYCVFNNGGYYTSPTCIDRVELDNGNVLYKNNTKSIKIFENSTVSIMNDMLENVVKNGTAKKMSFVNFPVYAKTGTVGFRNGNSDAYAISYTAESVLGVWYGAKENSLMKNEITGGSYPSVVAKEIWLDIYKNKNEPQPIEQVDVVNADIDKISYIENKEIILADDNCPNRYKISALFKKDILPNKKSTRFTSPSISNAKISVNNKGIELRLCMAEYVDARIYRMNNGKKTLIYDTKNKNKTEFLDIRVVPFETYQYYVVPYCEVDGKVNLGKEVELKKIKYINEHYDNWWKEEGLG